MAINCIIIEGRLYKNDNELTELNDGITKFFNFNVSHSKKIKTKDGGTRWINTAIPCVAWGHQAEYVDRATDQNLIVVRGEMLDNSYKHNGRTVKRLQLKVEEVSGGLNFNETPSDAPAGKELSFKAPEEPKTPEVANTPKTAPKQDIETGEDVEVSSIPWGDFSKLNE